VIDTVPIVGACGTVVAVIAEDGEEDAPIPIEFVAFPVNVYDVFDCKPVIVRGEDAPDAVYPPGSEVIVYEVIVDPPSAEEAVNATDADPLLNARDVPRFVATRDDGG
jgi:hypothetical protein